MQMGKGTLRGAVASGVVAGKSGGVEFPAGAAAVKMPIAGLVVYPAGHTAFRRGFVAPHGHGMLRQARQLSLPGRVHGLEELGLDCALGVLQLVQAAAQILAVARFDALANGGPGGQGLKLAAKRAHHGLVLWLGQKELERGDFNLVGLGRGRNDLFGGLRRSLGDGGGGLPGSALLFEHDGLAAQRCLPGAQLQGLLEERDGAEVEPGADQAAIG